MKKLFSLFLLTLITPIIGISQTITIRPQNDLIYKIKSDIGYENWNFGFILKDTDKEVSELVIKHYSQKKLVHQTNYSDKLLSAFIGPISNHQISSKAFHFELPQKANIDEMEINLFSGKQFIAKKNITFKKFEQVKTYQFPLKGTWFVSSGYDFVLNIEDT